MTIKSNSVQSVNLPLRDVGRPVVVTAADDAYVTPLVVMMYSVVCNSDSKELEFVILDGGIQSKTKSKVADHVKSWSKSVIIRWLKVDTGQFKAFSTLPHISESTFFRLQIGSVLPQKLKRVVYLDCDLVVETDIGRLLNFDLNGNAVGAVQDFAAPYVSSRYGIVPWKKLGLEAETPHFNIGVMTIDLSRWRNLPIEQHATEFLKLYASEVVIGDQEALNAALQGHTVMLDPRWNQMHTAFSYSTWPESPYKRRMLPRISDILQNPFIVHFTSRSKPWMRWCPHPLRRRYMFYLKRSAWPAELAPPPDYSEASELRLAGRFLRSRGRWILQRLWK